MQKNKKTRRKSYNPLLHSFLFVLNYIPLSHVFFSILLSLRKKLFRLFKMLVYDIYNNDEHLKLKTCSKIWHKNYICKRLLSLYNWYVRKTGIGCKTATQWPVTDGYWTHLTEIRDFQQATDSFTVELICVMHNPKAGQFHIEHNIDDLNIKLLLFILLFILSVIF